MLLIPWIFLILETVLQNLRSNTFRLQISASVMKILVSLLLSLPFVYGQGKTFNI